MIPINIRSAYILRLERGEEVVETLCAFVRRRRIRSGFFTGLGAAQDITLGFFDQARRAYCQRTFRGDCEIAALVGNVAWDGREPICHTHAVISNRQLQTFAGHLFSARVTVTCEIMLVPGQVRVRRGPDPATGLKLLLGHLTSAKD
ncbi:MAG: PPC domain-containing DNA-binding protein [candidate division WOR-3 bacterium]